MRVIPVPCLSDNYAYLVTADGSDEAFVVDPSEAAPVIAAIEQHRLRLVAIVNTHHHHDHVGGNEELVAKYGAQAIWHVGSANMTNAAFGQPGKLAPPRNRELMLRLTGRNGKIGPEALLEAWKTSNVFHKHEFRDAGPASPEEDSAMRRAVHALSSAGWLLHVKEDQSEPGRFDLRLDMQPDGAAVRLPAGYETTVRLLCRDNPRALEATMT